MIFIYANNVDTTLAGAISASATSLTLSSSANLPASIPSGAVFVITMNDRATGQNFEIIYATAVSGATLSGLQRAQEGTAAQSWLANDYAYSAPTAGEMNGFGQIGANNTWSGQNTFNNPVSVGAATGGGQASQLQQSVGAGALALSFPSRIVGNVYTNTTSRPLFVSIFAGSGNGNGTSGSGYTLSVGGTVVSGIFGPTVSGTSISGSMCAFVPPGQTYQVSNVGLGAGFITAWSEF
ncbi:hypothetical protein [Burkholderia cenocepacia]|uniref:hypothetical protein n=1 Tax=Burkholderia cenocepacia TaxID=95486 RepID=UPI000AE4E039|nr:hypothetical protein [Burkholderia cenocepacia]